jgi:predicted RND superfamily exporter protein
MAAMDIGLNINTLPVAAIAVGIGVDYGLYFLGRVEEEIVTNENVEASVAIAIKTTGKAITFTGVAIILAVVVWLFSSIRFQAEMGVLLAVVTIFQIIGTLVLLPAMVLIVKPGFLMKHIKEKGCRV